MAKRKNHKTKVKAPPAIVNTTPVHGSKITPHVGAGRTPVQPIKPKKLDGMERTSSTTDKTVIPLIKPKDTKQPKTFTVKYAPRAWAETHALIREADGLGTEVAWFTPIYVDRDAMTISVPQIYVPDQEVTGSTTESPDLGKVIYEAFCDDHHFADIKGWFHLHPKNMGVSPSGTDEDQAAEYMLNWDYMLRGIFNGKGDMKLDFYDKETGLIYQNLAIEVDWAAMYDTDKIVADCKERVSRKTYQSTYPNQYNGYGNTYNPYGQHNNYGRNAPANQYAQNRGAFYPKSAGGAGITKSDNVKYLPRQDDLLDSEGWPEVQSGHFNDDEESYSLDVRDSLEDGSGLLLDMMFFKTLSGTAAYCFETDIMSQGENADLFAEDGVELGFTFLTAMQEGLCTAGEIVEFLSDHSKFDTNSESNQADFIPEVTDELMRELDPEAHGEPIWSGNDVVTIATETAIH